MLTLISHALCPYVQRSVIALTEKRVPFERVTIELSDKPDWFRAISPLGKTPVLLVGEVPVFESAVILDYLEETAPHPMYPADPLDRARHRAFIAVASVVLDAIAGFYTAPDEERFAAKRAALTNHFDRLEHELGTGPYFGEQQFGLVDCAFGPVFRYFEVFDTIGDFQILDGKPKLAAWRKALAERASVASAVSPDYRDRLMAFLKARGSYLSELIVHAT